MFLCYDFIIRHYVVALLILVAEFVGLKPRLCAATSTTLRPGLPVRHVTKLPRYHEDS